MNAQPPRDWAGLPGADSAHRLHCPRCRGNTYRIKRRWQDLLLSLLIPVQRYRCSSSHCGWVGNLRGGLPTPRRNHYLG